MPAARLALVGDGPDRDALRRLAPESVEFVGTVADARPRYRAADLVGAHPLYPQIDLG